MLSTSASPMARSYVSTSHRYIPCRTIASIAPEAREEALPSSSPIPSQKQILQGQNTCVKPTLTRPQSSKAECLILRHRRHAAVRMSCCTGELTVFLSTHAQPPNSQLRRFLVHCRFISPRSRQHVPSSVAEDQDKDVCLSSAMDIPSGSLPCLL